MEYFGFASGSSKTGPAFPYMPESILNSYPSTLMDHPAMPAAVGFLNMQTPDTKNLVAIVQTWADKSLALLDKPAVQAIGIGLSASICAYSVWRIKKRWRTSTVLSKNDRLQTLECEPHVIESLLSNIYIPVSMETDVSDPSTEITQRQLVDTRAKLDDLRFQLNRVEGEKDMLAAEVSMRKKIVGQLQGEIHIERDKRRQAELRMEMMEWENTHLRRLRKDVAVKEGKIDVLEASLKEKEVLHDKLFQENVILPKNVAAARAKEYEILHAKVQKYEMEAVMRRNTEEPYTPNRHVSLASSIVQTPYDASTETLETAVQLHRLSEKDSSESYLPTDWDKSPSSVGSTVQPQPFASSVINRAKTLIYSTTNWSNSLKTVKENARGDECEIEAIKEPMSELSGQDDRDHIEARRQDSESSQQYMIRGDESNLEKIRCLNRNNPSSSSKMYSDYASQRSFSVENEPGMLGQIGSFFGGFSHSGSESGIATILGSPARLTDVMPSQSRLWDKSLDDKASNGRFSEGDNDDDMCCPSVSDGHSSIFMSASCGSDTSDDNSRKVTQRFNQSSSRTRSLKRATSSKKTRDVKRKQQISYEKVKSASKMYHPEKISFPKEILPSENANFFKQVTSPKSVTLPENKPLNEKPLTNIQMNTSRQSRARQRCRLRKSRSKLTIMTLNTPKDAQPVFKAHAEIEPSTSVRHESDMRRTQHTLTTPQIVKNQMIIKSDRTNEDSTYPLEASVESRKKAFNNLGDTNKNSIDGTDADSEESWIVITPAK